LPDKDVELIEKLTPRELQILELASTGLSDKEISAHLGIHFGTVSTYWNRIRAKVDAPTRGAIIAKMVRYQMAQSAGLDIVSHLGELYDVKEHLTRVDDLLSVIPDPIIRTDLEQNIVYSNPAFRARLTHGDEPKEAVELEEVLRSELKTHLQRIIEDGGPNSCHAVIAIGDRTLAFEVRSVPEVGIEGKTKSVLSLLREES